MAKVGKATCDDRGHCWVWDGKTFVWVDFDAPTREIERSRLDALLETERRDRALRNALRRGSEGSGSEGSGSEGSERRERTTIIPPSDDDVIEVDIGELEIIEEATVQQLQRDYVRIDPCAPWPFDRGDFSGRSA